MRLSQTILSVAATACLTLSPAYGDSNGAASKPPTTGKPTTAGKPTTTTSTKPSGTTSGSTSTTSGSGSTSSTTTGSGSGSTTTPTPLNPIATKISSKPQLKAKINALLPTNADGSKMTLNQASLGFRNQGQFIAALHVSQNLGIPFTDLKKQMVTTQGTQATQTMSLGQAIQAVKKNADATTEAQKAETQASQDLKTTTTTTSGSSSTSTTAKNKTKKKTTHAGGDQ